MIYLDNAATGFPKPQSVYREYLRTMKKYGGNPGRGSHSLARAAADKLYLLREVASELFDCSPECVVFTFNATHALNIAIKGLARRDSHVLISDMEHNSVYRPVTALKETHGCNYEVYKTWNGDPDSVMAEIYGRLRNDTSMIVACHASNISGVTLPVERIGKLCRERGITFIIDASQSAGHLPVRLRDSGADAVCMAGHKGLMGPQGTGLLLLRDGVRPSPLMEGGSGIASLESTMPEVLPERLEAGTLSAPGASALAAGLRYISDVGVYNVNTYECEIADEFRERIGEMDGVTLYGPARGSIVLFNLEGMPPSHVGRLLDMDGVCVRSGLHCAPLAHRALRTGADGAVRASFGFFNTTADARRAADAVLRITRRHIAQK